MASKKNSKIFEGNVKEDFGNSDYESPSLNKRKKLSKQLKKNKKKKQYE